MWTVVIIFASLVPVCLTIDLTYFIQEGKKSGTLVGDIAKDSHLMDSIWQHREEGRKLKRKEISFSLLQQGTTDSNTLFHVSKRTGKLYTAKMLDAESLCTYNVECFKMVDVAVRRAESFMKILEIKVLIEDVNDHKPEFPVEHVDIEFSERDSRGTKISIPNAIDRDVGVLNSQIIYELRKSPDGPFSLIESKRVNGKSELAIRLDKKLDRERKNAYRVQVVAKDGGSPTHRNVLNVYISVKDENDNPPTFRQSVFNISILNEDNITTPLLTLSANDSDSEKNGRIAYSFSSDTSHLLRKHFRVNESTGAIFLQKKFKSVEKLPYKLYIEAMDGGSPPLRSIAMVLVNIVNQQNNPPQIDVNFVSTSMENVTTISEDIKVGSFIAYIKVTDDDNGRNGEVTCELSHEKFQLQSLGAKKYKILVKSALDRESDDNHELTIRCQDNGSPPLQNECKFFIKVTDVNDVAPQTLMASFKFGIYENQPAKFFVGSINATDPDKGSGGQLSYLMQTSNENLPFIISNDGFISTVISLDREIQDIYEFQVLIKDNGIPSLNTTVDVMVEVRDENDNAPYFMFPTVNPYTLDVLYNPHSLNNITILKAVDEDSLENAFLKYEITAGNEKHLFTLNPYTGLLFFSQIISPEDVGYYQLVITVKDSGIPTLSASTNLSLLLSVNNDTSGILNAVYMKTDDRIHMYLLIVIVLVAVIVSVPVTATISICFIQCKEQRHDPYLSEVSSSKKVSQEQEQLTCPPLLEIPRSDDYVPRATDPDVTQNTPSAEKRRSSSQNKRKKGSLLGKKPQKTPDIIYQVGI